MARGVIYICNQLFDISKIFFLISLICFAPRLFFYEKKRAPLYASGKVLEDEAFKLGIEQVTYEYLQSLCPNKTPRIALVTHGLDSRSILSIQSLKQKKIDPVKIFYPYKEIRNECYLSAMHELDNNACFMLDRNGFDKDALQDIDVLLVDMHDIGYSEQVKILFQVLSAAVRYNIPPVILDRPNQEGNNMEGMFLDDALHMRIPLKHGMTLGELTHFYKTQIFKDTVPIYVIPMHKYHRSMQSKPDREEFQAYDKKCAFVCTLLSHVTPIDVGIETPYAFSCIALPKSVGMSDRCWYELQHILQQAGVESFLCSYMSKQRNEICKGLRLHIQDMQAIDSFSLLLKILEFFKDSGINLLCTQAFENAGGSSMMRKYVHGDITKQVLIRSVNAELETFYRKAFGSFMYYPLPHLSLL